MKTWTISVCQHLGCNDLQLLTNYFVSLVIIHRKSQAELRDKIDSLAVGELCTLAV